MDIDFKQIDGKIIQIYSEEFKRRVIEEYLRTGVPKMDLLRKYGIKTKSGIQRWMKKFGYTDVYKATEVTFTSITSPTTGAFIADPPVFGSKLDNMFLAF